MTEKKTSVRELSRRVCSRVEEHETTTIVTERKSKFHSGLKFNSTGYKLKQTVPKPFSFDTGPKNRKESPSRHTPERSVSKHTNEETKGHLLIAERKSKAQSGLKLNSTDQKIKLTVPKPFSFDTGPKNRKESPCRISPDRSELKLTNEETKGKVKTEVKAATENLKVPKETRNCSKTRSVSRERVQNNTTKVDSAAKKSSVKCSRAEKTKVQPAKTEKSPVPKSVKSRTSNASKTEGKATKVRKSRAQQSETAKPQVHFSDTEKPGGKAEDGGSSSAAVSKSEISTTEVASYVSNVVITEESESKAKFNGEQPNEDTFKSEFLNGTGIHFEFDSPESAGGINLQSELANAAKIFQTSMSKSASKIPRKDVAAHSGIKLPSNFKEETVAEQLDFESRCSNFKVVKNEMNQVQISMVNN